MAHSFMYIADGILYRFEDGKSAELRSGVLDDYLKKVRESAERNEWKRSGQGATFTGTYEAGADAASRVAAVSSRVCCAGRYGADTVYSLAIDRTAGIYRKFGAEGGKEGIVISSGDRAFGEFDIAGDRMVLSSSFAGESHIGVLDMNTSRCDYYTEGRSWDSQPTWSAVNANHIYFSCAGLAVRQGEDEEAAQGESYADMLTRMYAASAPVLRGPASICLLDIGRGTMDELMSDGKYDFVKPQSAADGSLYYIRKPYDTGKNSPRAGGCLVDTLLLPFRLVMAIFNFFNVFSAKYSGKTLTRAGDVKNRDEQKMRIDGNLINAEAELKANRDRGDRNPGIIPHTWELRRRRADGNDELVRRGVVAYRVDKNGDILVSNGTAILRMTAEGQEEKLVDAPHVTFIG